MTDNQTGFDDAEPMPPLDPDHDGDAQATAEDELRGVGAPIDLTDPLKRARDTSMPGLDPTLDVIPED